jgi:hypothetical protein
MRTQSALVARCCDFSLRIIRFPPWILPIRYMGYDGCLSNADLRIVSLPARLAIGPRLDDGIQSKLRAPNDPVSCEDNLPFRGILDRITKFCHTRPQFARIMSGCLRTGSAQHSLWTLPPSLEVLNVGISRSQGGLSTVQAFWLLAAKYLPLARRDKNSDLATGRWVPPSQTFMQTESANMLPENKRRIRVVPQTRNQRNGAVSHISRLRSKLIIKILISSWE